MLKIAIGQMEVIPGRPDLNTAAMLTMIEEARSAKADIIVFPEMAIPGYLLGDTWEQTAFIKDCEAFGQEIAKASANICVLFGNVAIDWNKRGNDGRVRKFNAFFAAYNGKFIGDENFIYPFRIKTLLPNYREFDDTRHFYSLRKLSQELNTPVNELLKPISLTIAGKKINLGCILCEDGWSDDYDLKPTTILQENSPIDLFVNISSSPYTFNKNNKRNRVFSEEAQKLNTPLLYVNNIGLQNNGKTVYTFDGSSTIYNGSGEIVAYCPAFTEKVEYLELDLADKGTSLNATIVPNEDTIACIYKAIHYGTKKFLAAIGMKKVVVGISGGIDSAVAAALYTAVLGPENVLLINMPSIYNSATTKGLAAKLSNSLGCLYTVIPIQEAVDHTITQLKTCTVKNLTTKEETNLTISQFVTENIQARDRSARILAGAAAAFGGGFTCNANKSEMTVGYSTLYGDQAGFLAALSDLWKHQVYALAEYLNKEVFGREVIPQETIDIVPSAELSFDQAVDEGKGDPIVYPYHDYLFRSFVERWNRATPEDILTWYNEDRLEAEIGCAKGLIKRIFPTPEAFIHDLERWWKLYSGMAVAKRIQAPPVLAVSRRAFGFDHREAQNSLYFTTRYLKLKEQLLNK